MGYNCACSTKVATKYLEGNGVFPDRMTKKSHNAANSLDLRDESGKVEI